MDQSPYTNTPVQYQHTAPTMLQYSLAASHHDHNLPSPRDGPPDAPAGPRCSDYQRHTFSEDMMEVETGAGGGPGMCLQCLAGQGVSGHHITFHFMSSTNVLDTDCAHTHTQ